MIIALPEKYLPGRFEDFWSLSKHLAEHFRARESVRLR